MKKKHIYYSFWVTVINSYLRTHPIPEKNWKFWVLLIHSTIFISGIGSVILWLLYFNIIPVLSIRLNIFPGETLDRALTGFMLFGLPYILVNGFLIFRNNKYLRLIERYSEYSIKSVLIFGFSVMFLFLINLFITRSLS